MKRVLIVGMFDSVHLARWVDQFDDEDFEIEVFPSSRFRHIHPKLAMLISQKRVHFHGGSRKQIIYFLGFLDYLKYEITRIFPDFLIGRSYSLKKRLNNQNYDIVHLIEIQHAGYLYLDAVPTKRPSYKTIITNYGSDIFFFRNISSHELKIRNLLSLVDYYSAECRRDYVLAKELGFTGIDLPLMPNAGGFELAEITKKRTPLSARNKIYVKGYGGMFGLGSVSLRVSQQILDLYPHVEVVIVSLTSDLLSDAEELKVGYGERVTFFTIHDKLPRELILDLLSASILTLGISRSDGISTTFLEALVCGAIPIQTDTSCASEWIERGFQAKIVPPRESEILIAAREILDDLVTSEEWACINVGLAIEQLSTDKLKPLAKSFYSEIGNKP